MTLDEAIEERLKVIEVQEKLHEEASTNESKEIIKSATDNDRQIVEWLTQLKEAKQLLKATINDIYKECSCNTCGCDICEYSRETCDYDDRFTWRHKAEALKLIES
jgi:ubiquitin C-terminal hydrolase